MLRFVFKTPDSSVQALTAAEDGTIIVWDMTTYTSVLSVNESTIFRVRRKLQHFPLNLLGAPEEARSIVERVSS